MRRNTFHQNSSCKDVVIKHQLKALYTLEKNRVNERRNRYIMKMIRYMLHEKGLSNEFWAKTANMTIFLQNHLPINFLEEKTPFKSWYDYKSSLNFLKFFGSICFVHVPQVKQDKLDKKTISRIIVGYSLVSKAYKIYLQTQKMIITRDHEDEQWD